MAQTPFTLTTLPAATAVTGVALTLAACDAVNGNSIVSSDREIAIVINIDVTPTAHTFTITGQADRYGRTANFSQSVAGSTAFTAAGLVATVTPRLRANLWSNNGLSGGLVLTPSTNDTHLVVGVITGT